MIAPRWATSPILVTLFCPAQSDDNPFAGIGGLCRAGRQIGANRIGAGGKPAKGVPAGGIGADDWLGDFPDAILVGVDKDLAIGKGSFAGILNPIEIGVTKDDALDGAKGWGRYYEGLGSNGNICAIRGGQGIGSGGIDDEIGERGIAVEGLSRGGIAPVEKTPPLRVSVRVEESESISFPHE